MIQLITNRLKELTYVLRQLKKEAYSNPVQSLSNATIGQHTRHIIELFQCLQNQYESGAINYDARKRNPLIETAIENAITCLDEIITSLEKPDKPLEVIFYLEDGGSMAIASSYFRELLYNLEHCIHHEALIKVALLKFPEVVVNNNFGVAPSTIQYRKTTILSSVK